MADRPKTIPPLTPGDNPAQQGASDRLESWKEIAAHLKRTLRTVQRWERSEGLPVHRHQHEERASVYAFKSEIVAWWKTRRIQLETEAKQQGGEQAQVSLEEPEGPTPAGNVSRLRSTVWLAGVVAAATVALLVLQPWNRHGRSQFQLSLQQTAIAAAHSRQVTLAVLPFKNLSRERDIDYLQIALPDQIATILSHSSGIAVRPFASTEKYAGKDTDPQTAGRELKVTDVVTGHFLRERDRLQLTLEAVDVENNQLFWTDTVSVASADPIGLDTEISSRTQQGLISRLAPTAVVATPISPPQSAEAYDLYLHSLAMFHDPRANNQAIPMLERAVTLDPNYAPAWQELGQRYYLRGHTAGSGGDPDLDRSDAATQRALVLNSDFPSAARSLTVSRTERGDLDGAYDAAREFLRRRPNDAQAHGSMGYVLRYAGLVEESAREYETALKLDPTNYILRSGTFSIQETGDYKRAHEFLQVDAGSEWAHGADAGIFLREGKYEEAADAYRHSGAREAHMMLACINHRPRAEVEAEAVKAEADVLRISDPEDRMGMAGAYSFCGLKEGAFRMMRLAVEGNYLPYPFMDRDPLFANIRGTPEFAAIRALAIQKQNQFLAYRTEREHESVKARN